MSRNNRGRWPLEQFRAGMVSVAFCFAALTGASAPGQPQLDLSHSWVRSFPGASLNTQSYANGVAVLDSSNASHRGTVVVAGHSTTDVMIMSSTTAGS